MEYADLTPKQQYEHLVKTKWLPCLACWAKELEKVMLFGSQELPATTKPEPEQREE